MKDEINEVYKKYSEAVTALWYFLTYARKNQKKDQQSILEIMEKFKLIPGDFIQKTGLIEISLTKEEVELTKKVLEETKQNLDKGFNILEDMAVIYLVALFDAFLVDILSTILTNKPEMMKSSKKSLTYEKIIELRNPVELIVYLVQKEMNEFSYKSIKEQAEYVSSRFGINIEDSGISIDSLVELRARRNILVHNNGVVNTIFLESVTTKNYKLGDKILTSIEEWNSFKENLRETTKFLLQKSLENFCP